MRKPGYVYIMASRLNGTIYTGVTSNLIQRAYQHRRGMLGDLPAATGASFWSGTRCTKSLRRPA